MKVVRVTYATRYMSVFIEVDYLTFRARAWRFGEYDNQDLNHDKHQIGIL